MVTFGNFKPLIGYVEMIDENGWVGDVYWGASTQFICIVTHAESKKS